MKKTMPQKSSSVKHKQGLYITNGVILQPHEQKTVNFLLNLGYKVELIPLSKNKREHTADIKMLGIAWEMKSPKGEGKYTIQDTLRRASKQSANIIVDLRRTKLHQTKCINELSRQLRLSKNIRHLLVISKQHQLLDLSKEI